MKAKTKLTITTETQPNQKKAGGSAVTSPKSRIGETPKSKPSLTPNVSKTKLPVSSQKQTVLKKPIQKGDKNQNQATIELKQSFAFNRGTVGKTKNTTPSIKPISMQEKRRSETANRLSTQRKSTPKIMQPKQRSITQTQKEDQSLLLSGAEDAKLILPESNTTLKETGHRKRKSISVITTPTTNEKTTPKSVGFFDDQLKEVISTRIRSQRDQQENQIRINVRGIQKQGFLTQEQSDAKNQFTAKRKEDIIYEYEERIQELQGYINNLQGELIEKQQMVRKNNPEVEETLFDSLDQTESKKVENPEKETLSKNEQTSKELDRLRRALKHCQIRIKYLKEEQGYFFEFTQVVMGKIARYKQEIRQLRRMHFEAQCRNQETKLNNQLEASTTGLLDSRKRESIIITGQVSKEEEQQVKQLRQENAALKQKLHMSMMVHSPQVMSETFIESSSLLKQSGIELMTSLPRGNMFKSTMTIDHSTSSFLTNDNKNDKVFTLREFIQKYKDISKAKIIVVEKLIEFVLRQSQQATAQYFDPDCIIIKGCSKFLRIQTGNNSIENLDKNYLMKCALYLNTQLDQTTKIQTLVWNLALVINYVKNQSTLIEESHYEKEFLGLIKILKNVFKNYIATPNKKLNLKAVSQVIAENIY